jgi:acyl-coenzyme A synthetase/AMP-(fatty) acid ligase
MSFSGFFFFIANQFCICGPAVLVGVAPDLQNIVQAISAWEDSVFLVTPPLCRDLLALASAAQLLFPKVRAMFVGAAPLFAEEKRAIKSRLTPNFYEVYGNAATGFISALRPGEIDDMAETVGRVAPGIVVETVDAGEKPVAAGAVGHIRCRGPGISERFFGPDPGGSAGPEGFRGGWYYPGDIGTLDPQGFITLKGRGADLIRRRGIEIFPPEIEEVLARHSAVAEVAVVGVSLPGQETQLIAVMVPRGEAKLDEVAQHCRDHLPPEKFPNQLFWAEKLPRTGPGKIDRPALAAGLLKRFAAPTPPKGE